MSYQSVQIDYIKKNGEHPRYSPYKIIYAFQILFLKREEDRSYQTEERPQIVHTEALCLKEKDCQQGKYREGDNLLDNLQLEESEGATIVYKAEAVCGHHSAILKQRNKPTDKDDGKDGQCRKLRTELLCLQVAIPRKGHKCITHQQQENCIKTLHSLLLNAKSGAKIR